MTTPRQRLERDVLPYFVLAMFALVPLCIVGVFIAWLLGYVPER